MHLLAHAFTCLRPRSAFPLVLALLAGFVGNPLVRAEQETARWQVEAQARRISQRTRALQREAETLAVQERTLLADLRRLEIERELQAESLRQVQHELGQTEAALRGLEERMASLEATVRRQRPALDARFVSIYKLGRAGYLRLLFSAEDAQSFGRRARLVSALARQDYQRVTRHAADVTRLEAERRAFEKKRQQALELEAQAREARTLADRAVARRTALIATIDTRRDLHAQLIGELQAAERKLQTMMSTLGANPELVNVPLKAFKGELHWPVPGRVIVRSRRESSRPTTGSRRPGIEIASDSGSVVRAAHEGRVAFAGHFTGFGNLVILDHGNQSHSLYGFLSSIRVHEAEQVAVAGILGTSGMAPAGGAGVYFELRIDGKPVDPLEWLRRR